jgi:phenylalanine-4-hydroxylase
MPAAPQTPRADFTIDQGWSQYTAEEHAVWQTLYERQTRLLPGRACDEFVAGMQALPLQADRIPDFRALSEVLLKATGWQVVAVPGLVPDEVFFEHLANRRFPSGNFIRRPDELDYLEEPDVFHDVFGHVPMLMNPVMADGRSAWASCTSWRGCTGTRSNLACCASMVACASTAPASPRRMPKACLRSTTPRPTASASTWNG